MILNLNGPSRKWKPQLNPSIASLDLYGDSAKATCWRRDLQQEPPQTTPKLNVFTKQKPPDSREGSSNELPLNDDQTSRWSSFGWLILSWPSTDLETA